MKQQKIILNLFVFSVMFLLIVPSLIQKGLFMDGEIYSAIAHNLHIGKGSFWFPHWTGDIYSPFHQHPPLAFGLQSLYYDVFGGSLYTDRLFSFSLAVFAFILIGKIWKICLPENNGELSFLPRLFWITVPVVFWCYSNNMLENTVTVMTLLSVFALLKAGTMSLKSALPWYFLAAFALIAGFLSKGPVALFPLGVPFIQNLVDKKYFNGIKMSGVLWLVFAVSVGLLILLVPNAKESIETYINNQVQPSLKREAVVVRRTYILERLLMEVLPMIGLVLIYFLTRIKSWKAIPISHKRSALLFLLIGFSASLPIMISPKQLMFYISPSIPYFAIAASLILANQLKSDLDLVVQKKAWKRTMPILTSILLIITIILIVNNDGKYRRDQEFLGDAELIGSKIPPNSQVSISSTAGRNWMILAYLPRYYELELYRNQLTKLYIIQMKGDPAIEGYELVEMSTQKLQLLRKQDQD